jgi:TolB protein
MFRTVVRVAIALAVILVVPFAGAQTLPRPGGVAATADPSSGRIAFVMPDGRPATVDPATGRVRVLSPEPQRASFPSWSPDGRRVAFGTLTARAARVDVVDPLDLQLTSVYESPSDAPIYVSWGPSSDDLAMLAVDVEGMALHLLDVRSASSRIFARGSPFFWSWSRSGERMLVHRDVLGAGAVVGFTELSHFEVADPLPHPGVFQSPALSPTERFVAYATLTAGDVRRIVIAPSAPAPAGARDDEALETRELPHVGLASLAWHPRLDLLAAQRGAQGGFGSIVLLDAVTGDLEVVTPGRSLAFFWSPDGASIAYLTLRLDGPGFGDERRVSAALGVQDPGLPRLTVHVFDVASGRTREVADFVPTLLFVEQFLPFFDQYARSHRVWSPSGDALVFAALDPFGAPTITLFALDGSVTPLAQGEMPSFNVR